MYPDMGVRKYAQSVLMKFWVVNDLVSFLKFCWNGTCETDDMKFWLQFCVKEGSC